MSRARGVQVESRSAAPNVRMMQTGHSADFYGGQGSEKYIRSFKASATKRRFGLVANAVKNTAPAGRHRQYGSSVVMSAAAAGAPGDAFHIRHTAEPSPEKAPKMSAHTTADMPTISENDEPSDVFYQREEGVTFETARKFFQPFIFHKESIGKFRLSVALLLLAKFVGITSPFILKRVVNGLGPLSEAAAAASTSPFTLTSVSSLLGMFCLTQLVSRALLGIQLTVCTDFVQEGLKRIRTMTFAHLHDLDLNYHRQGSKNTVFKINRALRSLDTTCIFVLGFFAPVVVEFGLLAGALLTQCGLKYLVNMSVMLVGYAWYTRVLSTKRVKLIAERQRLDKKQEFF
jgi:hypothetical protein